MKHLLSRETLSKIIRTIRPWVLMVLVILGLRYTGLLSGISFVTTSTLMQTGLMDAEPDDEASNHDFDFDFSVEDIDGNEMKMSDLKGKVIFLNMWATWCAPCRAEMPSIQALYDSVDHNKVAFVMLSIDKPEQKQKVIDYIRKNDFTFPAYTVYSPLPEQLQVPSIPTTFIISKDGKVRMKKSRTANYNNEKFRNFLKTLSTE